MSKVCSQTSEGWVSFSWKNRLPDCQVPLDLKAIIPVYFIEMVCLGNMVNPALFPKNKTKRLLYFNGEFDPSHPPSEGFSTQNYRSNFNFYKILLSSSLSKRSGNPFKGRKTLAALLDFAAKNIGQRNAFLGRGDDLPNDGSLPTADDALGEASPAATRGFAPSVSGGIIYTVADCQSSKDWSFCLCKQKECWQQDSWKLKAWKW